MKEKIFWLILETIIGAIAQIIRIFYWQSPKHLDEYETIKMGNRDGINAFSRVLYGLDCYIQDVGEETLKSRTIIFRNFLQFIFMAYCYDVTKQAYCKKLKGSVENGLQKAV